MSKNKHIVNAEQIGGLIKHAKTFQDKQKLIKQWATEMRKSIRYSKGVER
jgi:hypothetical protein